MIHLFEIWSEFGLELKLIRVEPVKTSFKFFLKNF
jgi:hypothetical protein